MNKKFIYLLLATVGLAGCSHNHIEVKAQELPEEAPIIAEAPSRLPDPDLKSLLIGQNVDGYTKKTTINAEFCAAHEEWFHAGCNGSQRATYYNAEETALLMGDYNGSFEHINSGYRNSGDGIQHFKYNKEVAKGYFTDITDDWSFAGQKVGVYYPTLTSLSNLIDQENDWTYDDGTFTYTKDNANVFHGFQFFAAPMLLEGNVTWDTVEIELKSETLEIRLVDDSHTIISIASITKGY